MDNLCLLLLVRLIAFRYWCGRVLDACPHPGQRQPIFFIPLAVAIPLIISAASFGAQLLVTKLLAPKAKPQVKGKLTGDITLTDSIWGASLPRVFGAAPGGGDNLGGIEIGCNIFWASEIRKIQTQIPGGGGHQGKGGGRGNTPATIQLNYKIDLAAAVGEGPLRLLRLKFNEDVVYGGTPTGGGTGPDPTRYEAEDLANTLTGTAAVTNDSDCSNGKKVSGIGPGGTLTFNFDGFDATAYIPGDPDPGDPPIPPIPSYPFYFFYISYKSDGDRTAYVKLNGTGGVYTFPDTGGSVGVKFITRRYDAEALTLEISSPNADAPEIDCLDISVETLYEENGRQTGIRDANFPPDPAQDNLLLPDPLDYDTNPAERYNAPLPEAVDSVMEITLANGASLAWYEGTEDQPVDAVIAAALGADSTPAFRGTAYARISNLDFTEYGSIPNLRFLVENRTTKTVSEICLKLGLAAGLAEEDLDLTAADGMKIRGILLEGIAPPNKTFEELAVIKNLAFSETSGGTIAARDLSDRSAVCVIRRRDLGAYVADGEGEPPLDEVTSTVIDESAELVREMELQFFNPAPPSDFGTDRARFVYPYTASQRKETRTVSAVLTKEEALAIARREVQKNHIKVAPAAFNVPYKYAAVEPGACFDLEIENNLQRFRLEEKTGSAPGVFECTATNENIIVEADDSASIPDGTTTTPIRTIKTIIKIRPGTVGTIIDNSPLVEAQEGKTGVYVAAAPRGAGGWESAIVYRFKGGDWQQVKNLTKPATLGRALDALPAVPADISLDGIDTTSSFTVDFFGTDAPSTVSEDSMLDGANPFLVGNEILTVQTWTRDNDYPNRWTATNLKRSVKNTGRFAAGHVAGERVVLLSDAVEFVPLDRSEIGTERTWKFVTSGARIEDTAPIAFTWTGENLILGKNLSVSASRALSPADDGKTLTNAVDAATVTLVLPAPVEEAEMHFAVVDAGGLQIQTPADGTIRFASKSVKLNSCVRSYVVGSTLSLRVIGGVHTVTSSTGTWEVDE